MSTQDIRSRISLWGHPSRRSTSAVKLPIYKPALTNKHCLLACSLSVPAVLKWTHPKNEQNCSSTSEPRHLNPMDILRNVFTSRIFSRLLLTVVWVLFLIPFKYIAKTKHYLKMGWCNVYSHL